VTKTSSSNVHALDKALTGTPWEFRINGESEKRRGRNTNSLDCKESTDKGNSGDELAIIERYTLTSMDT